MKKQYEKPILICEDLHPEEMLCGCEFTNPSFSELEMCSYSFEPYPGKEIVIFGENWTSCKKGLPNSAFAGTQLYLCYYGPVVTLFSS